MEQVKKWRKIGAGAMHLPGKRIKPNEVFTAKESEIPMGFRDLVELVDGEIHVETQPKTIQPTRGIKPAFAKKANKKGMFNVFNVDTKKKINDNPISEAEADEMIKGLTE